MPRHCVLTFVMILTLLGGSSAQASPITYVHTGFGSGTLGDMSFGATAPLAFTINAAGDTDNIQSCGGGCLFNDNTLASITIGLLGTFDVLVPTRYFANNGVVGFSRAGSGGSDLYDGPALAGWNMATSVGPIAGTARLMQWGFGDIQTTGGLLQFNDANSNATFTATVGGANTVPDPGSSLLLLGLGLAGLSAWKNRLR